MTYSEFFNELGEWNLTVKNYGNDTWGIGYEKIANTMLFFKYNIPPEEYNGNITVKAVNAPVFLASELKEALSLVNELLMTPISERGEL